MAENRMYSGSRCSLLRRLITVEPIVFFYMFGVFLQFTAFLSLTYDKACLMLYNATFCTAMDNKSFQQQHKVEQDNIQSEASYWLIVTNVAMTVPAILSVFFFMGPWGDKVDRKLPLLFPCAGAFLYGLSNLVNAHFVSWPIPLLIPGLILNGLCGGYGTMLMASYSYITHITRETNRMVRVGVVGAMIYMAATISVFISGLLVQLIGHVNVFVIVCACMGAGFVYGVCILPSVVPEKQEQHGDKSWCDKFLLSTVRETWAFIVKPRDSNQKLLLALEITILNIVHMCTSGEGDILFLYLKRSPRSFTRAQYGYFKGSENFTRSLALVTLLPLLKRKLSFRDSTIIIIGLIFKTMTLVTLGVADSLLVVFLGLRFTNPLILNLCPISGTSHKAAIPALLQGFPSAGLRSSMAGRVDLKEHGRLFAVVAATQSCVTLATTFIFNGWYPSTLAYFDGTLFIFAAGLCVIATGIAVFVHIRSRRLQSKSNQSSIHGAEATPEDRAASILCQEKQLTINDSDTIPVQDHLEPTTLNGKNDDNKRVDKENIVVQRL
ncbi:proton-coupled folate transporter-like [Elysia marginata]|uniref:Proton-coupled folate transporter-like n=1 Tax=Elysia marginata TaxID=1093978 RepID=A0AAV4E9V2_9GAST|nr:proton-coupled folate transporter-like [Elysia marginata]